MTTDSEFYRDWRHSIDFGPPTNVGPLNALAASNDWALQMAYELQLQQAASGSAHISPLSVPESTGDCYLPELTDENATELVSNGNKTTTTAMSSSKTRTSSIFERFIRRPATSNSSPALNQLDTFVSTAVTTPAAPDPIDTRPEMDNQINKQRVRMAEAAAVAVANGSNRAGALDTNMNVLYI